MKVQGRYLRVKKKRKIPQKLIRYSNAEEMADNLLLDGSCSYFAYLSGNFIFGDLIEAIIVKNNLHVTEMKISTLSMSEANIYSLHNLIVGEFVDQFDLVISDYFYSSERWRLVPFLYEKLDLDDKFQLAVASSHAKVCTIKTKCGKTITMHGSANLRSSANIEQICVDFDKELYDFNADFIDFLIETYKTIKKPIRDREIWKNKTADQKNVTSDITKTRERVRKTKVKEIKIKVKESPKAKSPELEKSPLLPDEKLVELSSYDF